MCAAERHQDLLSGWLDTPTWTVSRRYLRDHPDLLADTRTEATLAAGAGDDVIRQHLAIVRLATTMSLDEVYDAVLDTTDATDTALAALDAGDLDRLVELWYAAPALGKVPFVGAYLAAVLCAVSGQPDDARTLVGHAAGEAAESTRTAGANRLHRLARLHPEHAGLLDELATLLTHASSSVDSG
jgi:hypothetical protein